MNQVQEIIAIDAGELISRSQKFKGEGWRLAQIGCTRTETQLEINYSFDRELKWVTLRLVAPLSGATVPSLSKVYWQSFLYENEIHDLFGITVTDMLIDYRGNFYRMSAKTPFNPPQASIPGGTV